VEIQENVSLAPYTTLKIGGPARYFVRAASEEQLLDAVRFARGLDLRLFLLGGGSNLVVADSGFSGLVIQAALDGPMHIEGPNDEFAPNRFTRYLVPSGHDWDAFVRLTCEGGFSGVECLAGIPGFVGGSPVQNIGAYGQEVSQTISAVHVVDLENLRYEVLPAAACRFAYRQSIFNSTHRDRYIVTRVAFDFPLDAAPTLVYADLAKHFAEKKLPCPLEIYEAVRTIRAGKGMLIDPRCPDADSRSAGSFFKNPVVKPRVLKDIVETTSPAEGEVPNWPQPSGLVKLPAAWLIEHAGFKKGFALGRVGISSKHTLALINRTGDASCDELLRLRDLIVLTVEQRFGVTLQQEPVMLA
jgi:UDP-N-acetylmuramate dehydrogenase